MKAIILMVAVVLLSTAQMVCASEVWVYQVGDMDDFTYDGHTDWPYVDPDWLILIQDKGSVPIAPLDSFHTEARRTFTFTYELAPDEQVVAATLALSLRAADSGIATDAIRLDLFDENHHFKFAELGWLPISSGGTNIRTLDLSDVCGTNLLPLLQDGIFNVYLYDDTAIDYATLTIEVIPEPATVLLLGLGAAVLHSKRRYVTR